MTSEFPRILTLLRKEKGVSQKAAAAELGVSQALLSHYEKGIRECGLNFLVKAADYYGVSCDYMLGRTPDRTGTTLTVNEIPEPDAGGKENSYNNNVLNMLNKKLINNSLNILYDMLTRSGSASLAKEISDYLTIAVYRVFRVVYSANPKNQSGMFKISRFIANPYGLATMEMCQANATAIADDKPPEGMDCITNREELLISTESIVRDYPLFGTSLLNLINNAEKAIKTER